MLQVHGLGANKQVHSICTLYFVQSDDSLHDRLVFIDKILLQL